MATAKCGCGKINWIEHGMAASCVKCGAALAAPPGGATAVAVASYAAPAPALTPPPARKPCPSCRGLLPIGEAQCPTCGWDHKLQMRKCVSCPGVVQEDYPVDVAAMGTVGGVVGFIVFFLFGVLGGLMIFCGIGSLLCLINAIGARIQCMKCSRSVKGPLLNEDERKGLLMLRLKLFGGAAGFFAAAIVLLVLLVVALATLK